MLDRVRLVAAIALLAACAAAGPTPADENWPQAGGPHYNGKVQTSHSVPTRWSVARGENLRWRLAMPETGQSGIAVWGDRLFLTTMKPIGQLPDGAGKKGSDIVLHCVDAASGDFLWNRPIAGDPEAKSIYAYGFSNSSSPTPVTDGVHVWCWNASGTMGCWTVDGQQVWTRAWTPTTGRPFNKQYEPIKVGSTVLNVEPLPPGDPNRRKDAWNYVHGFDAATGEHRWTAPEGLTHYNTPVLGALPGGGHAVLFGRGAFHGTPESPAGLTLTRVDGPQAGQALWSWDAGSQRKAMAAVAWDQDYAYWLDEAAEELVLVDTSNGAVAKRINRVQRVAVTAFDEATQSFSRREGVNLAEQGIEVFPAWYTTITMRPYVYFQCFDFQGMNRGKQRNIGPRKSLARINIETDEVEYLELPFPTPQVADQVARGKQTFYPRMTVNNAGVDVAEDRRSGRTGWWWCFNGNPIAVNRYLYFTFMGGRVQVVDGLAEVFDQRALVALNDLGEFGATWSVTTPSYSRGRLYHRTMKELVCIEAGE